MGVNVGYTKDTSMKKEEGEEKKRELWTVPFQGLIKLYSIFYKEMNWKYLMTMKFFHIKKLFNAGLLSSQKYQETSLEAFAHLH